MKVNSEEDLLKYLDINVLEAKSSDEINNHITKASEVWNKPVEEVYKLFYERVEKRCRDKLTEIAESKNAVEQEFSRKNLEDWLNRFLGDRQKTTKLLTKFELTICKTPEIFTLYDLKQLRNTIKVDYLVSEFLPRDCYILFASKPKIGKTNFLSSLTIALTTGRDWLDRKTVKSRVLFIQNEEPIETITLDRFDSGLADLQISDPELYEELIRSKQLVVARHLDLVADMDAILQLVQENHIDLVIIDSLSKSISIKSGLTEYSQELFPKLNQWHEACHRLHFSSIIIHHTTKVESTKDGKVNSDAIAGSNHLLRNNDGFWVLDSTKKQDELICYMVPRFSSEKSITFRRVEGEACYWSYEVVKESHLSPEELLLQNKILRLLYGRWEDWYNNNTDDKVYGLTMHELIEATSSSRQPVITCTNRMLLSKGIEKYISNRKWIYHFPKEGTSWMQVYWDKEDDEGLNNDLNQRNRQILLACRTTDEVNDLINSWSQQQRIAIWNTLLDNEKQLILLLRYPPQYQIGDTIELDGHQYTVVLIKYDNVESKHHYYYNDNDYITL